MNDFRACNPLRPMNAANQKSVCIKAEMRKCIISTLLVKHQRGKNICNKVNQNPSIQLKMCSVFLNDCNKHEFLI